jgi:hypothetical protein
MLFAVWRGVVTKVMKHGERVGTRLSRKVIGELKTRDVR